MILGIDGYLGWPLALKLIKAGHEVSGIDNFYTRGAVEEVGSTSAIPIPSMKVRLEAVKETMGAKINFYEMDVAKNYRGLHGAIKAERPDAIVHFAEQRSAPFSMIDVQHATYTMSNNIDGTLNLIYAIKESGSNAHIVKMGTMGEYGTPKFDILERAFVDVEINGKKDAITFPKFAGSWYHWSKVHDTNNMLFAHRLYRIPMTDIMQGPVYGCKTDEMVDNRLRTRMDFDEVWGTIVNMLCFEAAMKMPLIIYGEGTQTRAFLSMDDSMEALKLLIENPPSNNEYRVANQFAEVMSATQIAKTVQSAAKALGIEVGIEYAPHPRVEAARHYYNPEIKLLKELGFRPKLKMKDIVPGMIDDLKPYVKDLEKFKHIVMPKTYWKTPRNEKSKERI
jgi:nucleoside-diphosphate-sugar epimerase